MSVPVEILENKDLNDQIARSLPSNYKFEVHKTIWRIQQAKATCVAMQFPEGLLLYAPLLADILEKFAHVETIIMADVAYGACCIDDYSAAALGADFLVHYGHSCLVPIDRCVIQNAMYVFVEIRVDVDHFIRTVKHNVPASANCAIAGTIQFVGAIHQGIDDLKSYFREGDIFVPQAKPLSKGEILGCTAPALPAHIDTIVFLSDGRFHLEALMIQNPQVKNVLKYDPYIKKMTVEGYAHEEMHSMRQDAIEAAKEAKKFGLILGTLGRQGNPEILNRLEKMLEERSIPFISVLLSEILPHKMDMFEDVDAWVQIACPRLSIDWGYAYPKPLLTPYEVMVALQETEWKVVYPMDNYARDAGPWGNYFKKPTAVGGSADDAHDDDEESRRNGEQQQKKKMSVKERILLARKNRQQQQQQRIEIQITE